MVTTVRVSIGARPADNININSISSLTVIGHAAGWVLNLSAAAPVSTIISDKVVSSGHDFLIVGVSGSSITVVGDAFFHSNAPVIGAATTKRSFPNHYRMFAICSKRDFRLLDWLYIGEYHKEGTGPNGEWVLTRSVDGGVDSLNDAFGDATRHVMLTAAPGQSFIDSFVSAQHALKYDPSLGVAIRIEGGYALGIKTAAGVDVSLGTTYLVSKGLMLNGSSINNVVLDGQRLGIANTVNSLVSCVVKDGRITNAIETTNSVFYTSHGSLCGANSFWTAINCTMISTSGTGDMITPGNYMRCVLQNCAVFGFASLSNKPEKIDTAHSFCLATNLASDGTASGIPASLHNLNPATEFISLASGSEDLQLRLTSTMVGAGRPVAETRGLDVTGRPRSAANPSIGAAEKAWYAITPTVSVFSDRHISRGIARGFERGIV